MSAHWHNGTPGLVTASGELDLAVAARFEADIIREALAAGEIRIDLADVTFIDCSGLHALVNACHIAGRVVIQRPTEAVLRILDLTGTADLFDIDPVVERLPAARRSS